MCWKAKALGKLKSIVGLIKKAREVPYDANGVPLDPENITAKVAITDLSTAENLALAEEIAREAGYDPENIAAGGIKGVFDRLKAAVDAKAKAAALALTNKIIFKALRHWRGANATTFDTRQETENYLKAARTSGGHGFRTVIYGHTHLAKRIDVLGSNVRYFNGGTWVDLMAVPQTILSGNEAEAEQELGSFVDDLSNNRLDAWKQVLPTFVRVKLEGDTTRERDLKTVESDIFLYQGGGQFRRVEDRLDPSAERRP